MSTSPGHCRWCSVDVLAKHEATCHERKVPCQFCGEMTRMTGTKMCDNCHEVHSRIGGMGYKLLNKIIRSAAVRWEGNS